MKCASCGTENNAGVNFCKGCGKPLKIETKETVKEIQINEANDEIAILPSIPAKRGTKAEKTAFVLGVIAVVLHFIPVPLLAWFCLPCALIGFIAGVVDGQASRVAGIPYSGHLIFGFLMCAYVLAISLFSAFGVDAATVSSGAGLVESFANGMMDSIFDSMF